MRTIATSMVQVLLILMSLLVEVEVKIRGLDQEHNQGRVLLWTLKHCRLLRTKEGCLYLSRISCPTSESKIESFVRSNYT
jgi:hypothetical protein